MTDPTQARRLIPIACTLDDAQAEGQLGQWRRILGASVVNVERAKPGQLRLALSDDVHVADLISLARAEKACCTFFDFTLAIDADAFTLVIDVPPGSETVLDGFAHLAASHPI